MMEQIVTNILRHDGMRYMKMLGDSDAQFRRLLPRLRPCAGERCVWEISGDEALGICTLELTWPIYEPYEIASDGPRKFRRLMAVHYSYAAKVSDCIRLAMDAFAEGMRRFPKYAFVREMPNGAEDGIEVYGVTLLASELAPSNCVLVGGAE